MTEEYPGIYSLKGVNAIKILVAKIRVNTRIILNTNTFRRLSLKVKRSSKVSSFNTTKRYLFSNLYLIFLDLFSLAIIEMSEQQI